MAQSIDQIDLCNVQSAQVHGSHSYWHLLQRNKSTFLVKLRLEKQLIPSVNNWMGFDITFASNWPAAT